MTTHVLARTVPAPILPFDCRRTCRAGHWCRFTPLLSRIGPTRVHSHTARIAVEFRDHDALAAAVALMDGTWIGQGLHDLFDSQSKGVPGIGFRLRGWSYPLILTPSGELMYDDYKGVWGNVADLDRLKELYTLTLAEARCAELGWQTERSGVASQLLTVYHPDGGTLTVSMAADGSAAIDAQGFIGQGCHEAREALGIGMATEVHGRREGMLSLATVSPA